MPILLHLDPKKCLWSSALLLAYLFHQPHHGYLKKKTTLLFGELLFLTGFFKVKPSFCQIALGGGIPWCQLHEQLWGSVLVFREPPLVRCLKGSQQEHQVLLLF